MAALPVDFVYEGYWTNWSDGKVLGGTITLRSSAANAILAALTILVSFTGIHLWNLIAFVYFSRRASDDQRSGIFHHQQFLLRNVSDPLRYTFHGLKVAFSWRKLKLRQHVPLLFSVGLAFFIGAGFAAAGVMVSRIVTTSNLLVQVDPPICGHWRDKSLFTMESEEQRYSDTGYVEFAKETWQYARQCYGNITSEACKTFPVQQIDYQTSYESCPFSDICKLDSNPALTMDTGLLNSNDHFGLDSKQADQIDIRLRTTCTVLNTTNFYQDITPSINSTIIGRPLYPQEYYTGWFFGAGAFAASNFTWAMSSYVANSSQTYQLLETHYVPIPDGSPIVNIWDPIPLLTKDDASTVLLGFAGPGLEYAEPIDDPLFSAHIGKSYEYGTGEEITTYRSDHLIEVLACNERFQFCLAGGDCTSLTSSAKALSEALALPLNAKQNSTVRMFKYLIDYNYLGVGFAMGGLVSPPPLKAADQMFKMGDVIGLATNQWEIETNGLFALVLSSLQKGITDLATGPLGGTNDTQYYRWLEAPFDQAETDLCHSQKMRAPNGFSNISVFGLSFTIAMCGLIILIDFITAPLVMYIARYHNKKMSLSVRHWIGDGMLQVQRKAFEGTQAQTWDHYDHEVPVTRGFGEFHGLSVGDETEPSEKFNFLAKVGRKLSSMSSATRFSGKETTAVAVSPISNESRNNVPQTPQEHAS